MSTSPTPQTFPNPLTLVMPLKPGAEAQVGTLLAGQQGAIDNALAVVGTVHFARFVLFDAASPNLAPAPGSNGPFSLAVITTYDGDFDIYIQDFVAQLGDVFDALLGLTTDGANLVPVKDNVVAFTAWIKANDLSQQPPNAALSQYAAYPYTVQTILADCS
jgi:hypothetical protein